MYISSCNTSYQQNFGANLKIVDNGTVNKMPQQTIQFLEEEFPKLTKDLEGELTFTLADAGKMSEFRHKFSKGLNLLEARINPLEAKEELLKKFTGFADGLSGKMDIQSKKKSINDEISRLRVALEVENLHDEVLWKDERYLRIGQLEEKIRQLDNEDRKIKDNIVNIFGFRNVNLNGIFTLFH